MLVADAPSVTDWMQGWGSIVSLAVSTGALVFTGWLLRHEIRVRREEKADADAAQARLVVAHIVGAEMSGADHDTGRQVGSMVGVKWRVKNHSQAPIFDLFISIDGWEGNRWGEVIEDEASGTVKCNPPLPFDSYPYDPREALVKVEFTDAAGLRWTRRMGEPPERLIFLPTQTRRSQTLDSCVPKEEGRRRDSLLGHAPWRGYARQQRTPVHGYTKDDSALTRRQRCRTKLTSSVTAINDARLPAERAWSDECSRRDEVGCVIR